MNPLNQYKGEKVIIHCSTIEEAIFIAPFLNEFYQTEWIRHWDVYKEDTGFLVSGGYASIPWFNNEDNYKNYQIIEASSLMTPQINNSYQII